MNIFHGVLKKFTAGRERNVSARQGGWNVKALHAIIVLRLTTGQMPMA